MRLQHTCRGTLSLLALLATAPLASAQATRTWVSGVGDDANPCSRTAPCKTFAGAISKTAAHGVISVLDPGGYGGVTITKGITIENEGNIAGITVSGTNAIIVNAGATDSVVLRGLSIEGLRAGLNGIRFLNGLSLSVQNCEINGFTQWGIDFEPAGASQLYVTDTWIRNNNTLNGGGILVKPGASGAAQASLDGVRLERNAVAVKAQDRATVTIRDSIASRSAGEAFWALSASAQTVMNVESSVATLNGTGLKSEGALASMRIGNVGLFNNPTGMTAVSGGAIVSFGDNHNSGSGAPTGTIARQ
jgi:hypothetical protein